MINTQVLELAVLLALWSTKIVGERPISVMILAPPEHGKTEIIMKFALVEVVKIISDFNSYQFADFASEYQAKQKSTIMIPDFLKVIRKKHATQAHSLGILNAIMEEGWIGKLPLGQTITEPIQANLITALTQNEIRDKRHKWQDTGFMSRFLPLSYGYTDDTKDEIRSYIRNRMYQKDEPISLKMDMSKVNIAMPPEIARKVEHLTLSTMAKISRRDLTGFRLQKQLQVLCMASALSAGKTMADDNDFNAVKEISRFINFDFNKV